MKATFETGKKYEMRFIGDSDLRVVFECVKRTDKTATFKSKSETITKKVLFHDDSEYIKYGSYSMSPVIKAKRLVN